MGGKISLELLKDFAFTRLPRDSPLRDIILAENDEIDALTFLARISLWLRLSTFKRG